MKRVALSVAILCSVITITAVEGSPLQVKPFVGLSLSSYSTSIEDFDTFWGSKSGSSLGGLVGARVIPQLAGVFKVHIFEKNQEMRLWIPGLTDSVTYKAEWSQYFITVAARYYPVTLARISPYVDAGLLYSSVTEKYEAMAVEGHGSANVSAGGIGGALAGGIQVWITPQISVFGEAQVVKVTVKGGNEWLGIHEERAAGGRYFGGGVCLVF